MELERMDNPMGFRMNHLESLKNRATYLLKDSLKIARLALVDVSTAELYRMTEDATNGDEWGPTTKQMAEISNSIKNSEHYLRIVHVLHKRFALHTQRYWRQIHKSLILVEYLLCHGPEHLVMEFRQDKSRIEEFARFVFVDWKGVDRGSAVQRRAKHVLHLLMDEAFYKEERTRAQKISRGISGFGSSGLHRKSSRPEPLHSTVPHSSSAPCLRMDDPAEDSSTLLVEEDDQGCSNPNPDARKSFTEPEGDFFSPSTRETPEQGSFTSSPGSGRSTNSTNCDVNPNEESPTSILSFRTTSLFLDMDSVASKLEPAVCVVPKVEERLPLENSSAPLQKLLPPPPIAEYKVVMPRPPQSGSKVRRKQLESVKSTHVRPDLISI